MSPMATSSAPVAVLEEGLRSFLGRPARIAAVEEEQLTVSSHFLARWRVVLDGGERLGVIFKRLQPGEKLYGNEREVRIYRRLIEGQRFGAPALYASVDDEARGRYWLFLEDMGEQTLQRCGMPEWRAAVCWLAGLHAAYEGRADELRALGCLSEHSSDFYHQVAAAARCNLEQAAAAADLARFDRLMELFEGVVAFLVRQPRTLIHGDIFPKNLIVQPGPRIRPVDWESAAIGLAAWDLTRLLDGWDRERPQFVALYLKERQRHSGAAIDQSIFQQTLLHCQVLNILWYLRWSVEVCADKEFVTRELSRLETLGGQLRTGPQCQQGNSGG